MAYEKHTWKKGEKITSERLNNLETGIEDNKNEITEAFKDIEEIYLKIENLDNLVGLDGEAEEIKPLKKEAQLSDLIAKTNELISTLQKRGVLK